MKFLSLEWFDALGAALVNTPIADRNAPEIGIGQVVTNAPSGEVSYTVFVGGTQHHVVVGSTDDAVVTIVTDYASASAIAAGASPAALLYEGKIKLRGDANALLFVQDQLGALSEAMSSLSESTDF